ncbi:hypothetical protein [Macrococcoides canis]|uniref:hypothetical protein n=1 Tax=Macrococcoides canis TaxID=1855823 RepID=UPI0020B66118|nr:hypothetical protein [Macrococcus canis]UTH11588.1 hypothetical protein KFV10_00255 [Macrococcus canis]
MGHISLESSRDDRFIKEVEKYFKVNLSKIKNLKFDFELYVEKEEYVQGRTFRLDNMHIYISDYMICDMIKVIGMKNTAFYLYDKCFEAIYELYSRQSTKIDIDKDLMIIYMDGKKKIETGLYKKYNIFISSFILDYYKKIESDLDSTQRLKGDIDRKIKVGLISETFNGTSKSSEKYEEFIDREKKEEYESDLLKEVVDIFTSGNKNLIDTDVNVFIDNLNYVEFNKKKIDIVPEKKEIVTFQTLLSYINQEFWATVNKYYRKNIKSFDYDDLKFLTEYLKEDMNKPFYGKRFIETHKKVLPKRSDYIFTDLVLYCAFVILIDKDYLKKQNIRRYLKNNKWVFDTNEAAADKNYIIDLKKVIKDDEENESIEFIAESMVYGIIDMLTLGKEARDNKKPICKMEEKDINKLTRLIQVTILARFFFQREAQHFEFINKLKLLNDSIMGNLFKTKLINGYINYDDLLLRIELTVNEWISEQQILINKINNYDRSIIIKSEEYEKYINDILSQFDIASDDEFKFGGYFEEVNQSFKGTNLHMDLEKSMYSGLHDK